MDCNDEKKISEALTDEQLENVSGGKTIITFATTQDGNQVKVSTNYKIIEEEESILRAHLFPEQ